MNCIPSIPCCRGKLYKGETCRRLKTRLEEYFLWIPRHGNTRVSRSAMTDIHQLSTDTRWRLVGLPRKIADTHD